MAKETRSLEVVLGKALFALDQPEGGEGKPEGKEAAQEAWKAARKDYKKRARRLMARLERRGYAITKEGGAAETDKDEDDDDN